MSRLPSCAVLFCHADAHGVRIHDVRFHLEGARRARRRPHRQEGGRGLHEHQRKQPPRR